MDRVEEIITDEQLAKAWGYANFGNTDKREIVANVLLKCACGYYTGATAKAIVSELGLVGKNWTLTKLGKKYLWAAYSGGKSI